MKHLFKAMSISAGLGVLLPSSPSAAEIQPDATTDEHTPKTSINWFHFNTDSPTGVIGVFGGPLVQTKLSDKASISFTANAGGSVTFRQDGDGTTSAEISPTIKMQGKHNYTLGKLLLSFGLSASQTSVDQSFYGTHKIHGATGDASLNYRITSEVELFASSKMRVAGNLPNIRTVGASYAPFANKGSILDGTFLTVLYSHSTRSYSGDKIDTKNTTGILGHAWKYGNNGTAFAGVACTHVKMDQNLSSGLSRSVSADVCLPIAGFTVSY